MDDGVVRNGLELVGRWRFVPDRLLGLGDVVFEYGSTNCTGQILSSLDCSL